MGTYASTDSQVKDTDRKARSRKSRVLRWNVREKRKDYRSREVSVFTCL